MLMTCFYVGLCICTVCMEKVIPTFNFSHKPEVFLFFCHCVPFLNGSFPLRKKKLRWLETLSPLHAFKYIASTSTYLQMVELPLLLHTFTGNKRHHGVRLVINQSLTNGLHIVRGVCVVWCVCVCVNMFIYSLGYTLTVFVEGAS